MRLWLCLGTAAAAAGALPGIAASGGRAIVPQTAIRGLPLNFEPNVGQAARGVDYLAHGPAYAIGLNAQGATLVQPATRARGVGDRHEIGLRLVGARAQARGQGESRGSGVVNYYIGNDPAQWKSGVPVFDKVRYAGVYPGVDLVYHGNAERLEYDFVVAPGASAKPVELEIEGATARIDAAGNLVIGSDRGRVSFDRPIAYQEIEGERRMVEASYRLEGKRVRFALGAFDHARALIIDPVLTYFSYLGGTGYDVIGPTPPQIGEISGQAAAVDRAGELYVAGNTSSANFPTQAAYQASPPIKVAGNTWAFVTKFAADGQSLVFSTYLGGTGGNDYGYGIALDASGNAFVVGYTSSNDFPVTSGAYLTICSPSFINSPTAYANCNGQQPSAFVSKLSAAGALTASTFLDGDSTQAAAWAVAVDAAGRPYVTGSTYPGANIPSAPFQNAFVGFPTTAGALVSAYPYTPGQSVNGALQLDAFVAVFDPTLSTLVYSTLIGDDRPFSGIEANGSQANTVGTAIALDPSGNFYVAGYTGDGYLPTTAGSLEPLATQCGPYGTGETALAGNCGFVAKFSAISGANPPSLVYATYLGGSYLLDIPPQPGSWQNVVTGIAADTSGNAYVLGYSNAAGYPTTPGAYQRTCDGYNVATNTGNADCNVATIAKLNPTGSALLAGTYFGCVTCSGDEVGTVGAIALDASDNVYIAGFGGNGLPLVNGFASNNTIGGAVPFVAELDPSLATLKFSTFINVGNAGQIAPAGLALDSLANIYVAGNVNSPSSSAATSGAFQPAYGGGSSDGFVAKITVFAQTATALTASPASTTTGTPVTLTATVRQVSASGVPTGTVTFDDGPTPIGSGSLNGAGVATLATSALAAGTHSITAFYGGDANDAASSSAAVTVSITITVPSVVGATQAAASAAITGAGLTVGAITTQSSSSVPSGSVISQSPAGGASVAAGSAVNLVVSSGAAAATIPNVVNLSQAAAASSLASAGLTVGTVSTAISFTVAAGNVASQSPAAGTSVAAGSAVNLVIARNLPNCDVNGDGQIDSRDIALIDGVLNTAAAGPYDPRDADHNGTINILDARKCVTLCTHAGCAIN